ncbi:hypothetical protein C7974DRAFT_139792 [Boeremia exigua]|uniref:uncharacterized protein n=1 Tax=Boeremia exigua TaxID=749465 RepID=UPI001E8CE32A|nr:uncharacterized protein C7974DRAFT_139792 [Boeremia exigua]KAH6639862.1 hypothetical protein C7974DRAFT_139792 [Boeremia exigua]
MTMASANRFAVFSSDILTFENYSDSAFLRLPAEIRNQIYILAFDSATVRVDVGSRVTSIVNDAAALIDTCRQTRHEAKTFHGKFTIVRLPFEIQTHDLFADLCAIMGPNNSARIQEVQMTREMLMRADEHFGKEGMQWYLKKDIEGFESLSQISQCESQRRVNKASAWSRRKMPGLVREVRRR